MKAIATWVLAICLVSLGSQVWGQDTSSETTKGTGKSQAGAMIEDEASTTGRMRAKPMGRLPRYFSALVNSEQRSEIYRIQATYMERAQQLQEQLDALKAEEMEAIELVLDETQRTQLANLRSAAMTRGSEARKTDESPAESEDNSTVEEAPAKEPAPVKRTNAR